MRRRLTAPAVAAIGLLAGCAGGPPPPDWQMSARQALDNAVAAYLQGQPRVEAVEAARARSEIARTGRLDLLARAELALCAARVASLEFEPCAGFDSIAPDAAAPERAYADYLAARVQPQDIALLPASQREVAAAGVQATPAALGAVEDPLSRLIAAGVAFQTGRASPQVLLIAADTASAQGWRRPLLAWLNVLRLRAEQAGDRAEAERLRRRIGVVQGAP